MSDVTRILSQIESGDPKAAEQLLPLVYDELRKLAAAKMAQEKPGQTLQATALVHEAYLRLVDVGESPALGQPGALLCGGGRGHAADSGRQARERSARKGADAAADRPGLVHVALDAPPDDLLALDEALESLAAKTRSDEAGQAALLRGTDIEKRPRPGDSATNRQSPLGLRQGLAVRS